MYKFENEKQLSLEDFNQPLGLKMNPENKWVIKASIIPWETIEHDYAQLFPSNTGMLIAFSHILYQLYFIFCMLIWM